MFLRTLLATAAAAAVAVAAPERLPAPREMPPAVGDLPEGIASFGSVACDDFLYAYSGHTGRTHVYSTKNVWDGFRRVSLKAGGAWEELPAGPPAQGVVLATDGRFVYRVGGMQGRNEPGKPEDLHSVADAAKYDPKARTWTDLPPLPEGRSSHGAAIIDGVLYVVGGWTLDTPKAGAWSKTCLALDLKAEKPGWKAVANPPFKRRCSPSRRSTAGCSPSAA